ncbi:MAG TPA: 50S ribosomal protein L25/general stress protein Ctc [Marinospirillum sp.]|uniref:50S ribosomal protein L25/general stress protein Ctc n=1 Tax=Marinospirillum sp. TaxID=2183934 RepID=UPI002B461DA5|nr:50S ribosomal protein L25/general stress protein Ctc [Marinospirillum sp.]HKM14344.1 50S ribosomal protein L25/general stress protein Ctc [Marinospirillum sp.]
MSQFNFEAKLRTDLGKGASRRLRHENKFIPAIIYGGEAEAQSVSVEQREFYRILALDESVYTSVLNLTVDGKAEQVIIKDLQRHPFKTNTVMHIDFLRVDSKTKVTILVPFHFENEEACVGVKTQGGVLSHQMNDVEITAFPQDLPECLVVDVAALEVGHTLHLSDITLPKGVEIVTVAHGHDSGVVTVNAKRGGSDEDEDETPAAE